MMHRPPSTLWRLHCDIGACHHNGAVETVLVVHKECLPHQCVVADVDLTFEVVLNELVPVLWLLEIHRGAAVDGLPELAPQ